MNRNILLVGGYAGDHQISMQLYGDGLERLLLEKGWRVKRIKAAKIFGYLACGSRSLQKWLGYLDKFILYPIVLQARIRGFDLIHVLDHSYSWLSFFIPFQKTLLTCHDLLAVRSALGEFLPYHETRFTGKILQKWILWGLRHSRSIVCVSHQTQVDLHRLVPESRRSSWVIENGMNRKLIVPSLSEARERLMDIMPSEVIHGKTPYFFHVGGNVWYKNRISILQAFHQIINQYPVKLVLAGGEINPQEKELIHSLKLEDFVIFVGKINDCQLEALYKLAAALVFPSWTEGFGWPLIESQYCGCRVITSNREPMRSIAGKGAILVSPDSVEQIAEGMRLVLAENEELCQQRLQIGFLHVQKYSSEIMIDSYQQLYKRLMGEIS